MILKKKIFLMTVVALSLSANITVFAKEDVISEQEKTSNSKPKSAIAVTMTEDEESDEMDPEIIYAYDGIDYVYAKAVYNTEEYAIPRSKYGSFLKGLQEIGTKEEYFSPTVVFIEEKKEKSQWEKIPYSYENWDQERWDAYNAFAATFVPDEWQKTILNYYSLSELYAYYMGYDYYIDEFALKQYVETGYLPGEKEEEELKEKAESYAKVVVQYDLDSMYDKEETYCITADYVDELNKLLGVYDVFDEEKADIVDPNSYAPGKYQFEVGTMSEYISTYEGISKKDAQTIVSFIKKNEIPKEEAMSTDYMVRVRTKNGTKNVEKKYVISSSTFMTLVSKYLDQYANHDIITPITNYVVADDAKG